LSAALTSGTDNLMSCAGIVPSLAPSGIPSLYADYMFVAHFT